MISLARKDLGKTMIKAYAPTSGPATVKKSQSRCLTRIIIKSRQPEKTKDIYARDAHRNNKFKFE